ncbi:unnamed protein product [Paramecium octaurelia]|uniref:Uncharacterized protein n=1 Tax=Paramecium octaurelia TaxID=43137 RepID=A0A8S1YSB2_PAROT|nr:unnamed protein product [Paramecium octaurelia]
MIKNHNRRNFWIEIYLTNLGLISLKLSIVKCQYQSAGCITQYHKLCQQWKLHQYSFTEKFITYSEGWTFELNYYTRNWCGNCQYLVFSEIQYRTQLPPHQDVLIRLFKDDSNPIIVDYAYGKQTFDILLIEILIKNHQNSLFVLKITTQSTGIQSHIRDFEIFYTQPEVMLNIFNEGCLQYLDDKCLTCLEGWIQDEFLKNCHPICGDGIIQGQEECDDNNLISDDGCIQCRFSCPNFCNLCKFGKCLHCQSNYQLINSRCEEINKNNGFKPMNQNYYTFSDLLFYGNYYHLLLQDYFINRKPSDISDNGFQAFEILESYFSKLQENNGIMIQNCLNSLFKVCLECQPFYKLSYNKKYCIPICNDGVVVENETCDDYNNIQFDGCYQCQLGCQLECNQCIQQQCYSCIDGWQIIDYRCYQICGDGYLAISSSEQCDDGNYQPYDGCYNQCQDNFEKSDQNYCKPICGDGIIIEGLEECEDLNDIQYDGCYQCFFQCSQNCSKCNQGKCQECAEGYDLIISECNQVIIINDNQNDGNKAIQNQCGDQILSTKEQCDDGNQYSGDGCSIDCKVEKTWKCNQEQPNQCFIQTKFVLKYENQTYEHQFIFLQFSNEVKYVSKISFQDSILAEITNLNKNQYQIKISSVVNVSSTEFTLPLFEFDVIIFEVMTTQPNFSISINSTLIDNNDMPVSISSQYLLLNEPKVLTQIQIKVANRFQDIGNALIIGLGAISILMLLFGDLLQSLEIFDILQYQSYLKFVNVSYPQNLYIYFQSSEIVTVSPILISCKIMEILNNLIPYNFIPSIGKLKEYQMNADFLLNIQSQISQIAFIVILYLFLKFYPKFLNNFIFTPNNINAVRQMNQKWLEKLISKIYQLNKKVLNLKNIYSMEGFRQLYYANSWDLLFKAFLYITSNAQSGYRSIISYSICFAVLGLAIIFLLQNFRRLNQHSSNQKLRFEQYEGIMLLKKLLFILILIDFQNSEVVQCLMLSLLILGYIGLLSLIKKNIKKIEFIGIIWMEIPVIIFTLTSLIYCSDFSGSMAQSEQILAGFCQIVILILGLLGPLIKLGIKLCIEIKLFYQKKGENPLFRLNVSNILQHAE